MPTYEQLGFGQGAALTGDRAKAVFGQVMGLVAVSVGFTALGAYILRNAQTGGLIFFIPAFACMWGLNIAAQRGREQLAVGLLFGMALFMGMAISSVVVYYAKTNPAVVYQAAGATALFTAALGSWGYATRRDLSSWQRPLFWALLALIGFGLVLFFVTIPAENVVWGLLVLVVFGGLVAFDFNRLARTGQYQSAVPIAAAIFLDVLNIFLAFLAIFGGGG